MHSCGQPIEYGYWTGTDAYSSRPDIRRKSGTVLEVPLTFDGTDFDTDATLTFTVKAAAIENYDGPALTAEVPVAAYKGVSVSVTSPLTEVTLEESVVTLTLTGVDLRIGRFQNQRCSDGIRSQWRNDRHRQQCNVSATQK